MKNEIINIAKRDFLAFALIALRELDGTEISNDRYVEVLASELIQLADGSTKRVVINLPPRHLKTYLCTIVFAAWILAHNAQEKLLIVSYSQELAENIARSIRSILQSRWFKKAFATRIAKGHAKVNNFATTAGGQLYAVSIDGSVTGFGANLIIVDDPHNLADAGSPHRLEQTTERFHSIIEQRLNNPKKGRILVVGHRVHEADLSADLVECGWKHLALPMIATKDKNYVTDYGRWRRKKGELLRPDAHDIENVERLRRRLVNPGFDLLFQQDADAQALPALTAKHFLSYDAAEIQDRPHFISVDPGTGDGEDRSFNVVQVWASDGSNYFLVDQFRERCDFIELKKATRRFAKRHYGAPILIEHTANGPALLSTLTRKQQRRAHAIVPRDSKTTRFRRHLEKLLAGRVRLPNSASFAEKFVNEIVKFPHGRDDQVDAMTQFFDWLEKNDDIDFSKTNRDQRGLIAIARGSDFRSFSPSYMPSSTPAKEAASQRGLIAIARPQIYNPLFRR